MSDVSDLRATAHPVRLQILSLLTGNQMTQGELSRRLGLSASSVGFHLAPLKRQGLVVEVGRKTMRGGTATLLTHNISHNSVDEQALSEASWRAIAGELVRRAAFRKRGRAVLADADLSLKPAEWQIFQRELVDLGRRMHEAARPAAERGNVRVSLTIAAFELRKRNT